MSDIHLELQSVGKKFHQGDEVLTVLREVDLAVRSGEMVALVGPSGAGKSTLLQISGLLEGPDSGNVLIDGQNLKSSPERQRTRVRAKRIGFVYQFHHLLPDFSALENIVIPQMIAGKARGDANARAEILLHNVGLSHRIHHRPGRLSGGEQQRVAIARALANEPGLLLADEPTGNLDPETSSDVFEALVSLVHKTGLAALIATHNLELAKKMDRILVLEDGHVTQKKSTA